MKKSYFAWAALLALLLVLLLVVSMPARLLYRFVPAHQVLVQGVTGTLWQGSAASVQVRLQQGYFQLGETNWELKPWSLLALAPRVNLSSIWGNQILSGELVLRGQRDLDVRDLELQFAAALLGRFAPVALDGSFNLQMSELELRDGLPYSTSGRLVWQGAGWQSPRGLIPLGTYALEFQQPPGEVLRGEVLTVTGPIEAYGTLELDGRAYVVDILMGGEGELEPQLQEMLSLIAAPEDENYRISVDGSF